MSAFVELRELTYDFLRCIMDGSRELMRLLMRNHRVIRNLDCEFTLLVCTVVVKDGVYANDALKVVLKVRSSVHRGFVLVFVKLSTAICYVDVHDVLQTGGMNNTPKDRHFFSAQAD